MKEVTEWDIYLDYLSIIDIKKPFYSKEYLIIKAGEWDIYLDYLSFVDNKKNVLSLPQLREEIIKIVGVNEYLKTVRIFGKYQYNNVANKY